MALSANPDNIEPGEYILPRASDASSAAIRRFDPYQYDYSAAVWGGCGARDKDGKIVRRFKRAHYERAWVGSYAYLNCGRYDGDGYGFNHILKRHSSQFAQKAAFVGSGQWRHAADFAMFGVAGYPTFIRYDPTRGTYCSQRMIYVYRGKQLVNEYKATMVLGRTGRRIITALPRSTWCQTAGTLSILDIRAYDSRG